MENDRCMNEAPNLVLFMRLPAFNPSELPSYASGGLGVNSYGRPPNPCPRSPRSTWAKGQSYASVPGETGLVQNVGKNRTKRLELGRWKGSSQREPEIRDQGFRHSRNPVLADGTATKSREELDPNGGSYRADFGLSGQPRYSVRRYLISAALPATLRRGPASQGIPLSLSTR